jgi:glycosyltransferase involved in cell wall biosynthesis
MSLKVSIIIPTYNQSAFILDTVKSAIAQTYSNKEIIIADDNSTDESQEILKQYLKGETTVYYYRNEENIGRVNNYRKALYEYATGDLALMLDGDDFLIDDEYIAEAVRLFEQNQEVVLVFAKHKTLFEANHKIIEDIVNNRLDSVFDGNFLFINYWKGYSIPHLTSLYKRHYAMEIDYYCENIQSSDWESVLRLIQGKKVGFINKFTTVWRKHELNASRSMNEREVLSNLKYIENAYQFALDQNDFSTEVLLNWKTKMLKRYFFRILVQANFHSPVTLDSVWNLLKNYSSDIYKALRFDFKYNVFRLLKLYRPALFFVAKYVLKQESMLKDLEMYDKKVLKVR